MSEASIEKVPTVSVVLSREAGKDKKGEPVFKRLTPPIGEAFKFTKEEVESLSETSPFALRDPKDESTTKEEEVRKEAASVAARQGGAPGDAATTAAAAAKAGKPMKPDSKAAEDDDVL